MMEEEVKPVVQAEEVNVDNYKQIVDDVRNQYEARLAAEKEARLEDAKNYATAVLNGQTATEEDEGPKLRPADELKKEYESLDEYSTTDVQRWVSLLNWRDSALVEGKGDIFCLTKPGQAPTEEAKASAERTADVIKQCIEDSNYDDAMFKVLLDKRLVDPAIIRSRK